MPRPLPRRARTLARLLLLLFFGLAGMVPSYARAVQDNGARAGKPSYEQRASAEKMSRSRYRRLEIASIVLILGGGGAAILWAIKRK
jgi:hypothetical protein